jgi:hypothetical protein
MERPCPLGVAARDPRGVSGSILLAIQPVDTAAIDVAQSMAEFRQRLRALGYDPSGSSINARVSPQVR